MNLKYLFGALISLPLLPIMYIQAKIVRARVPKLPEAEEPSGTNLKTSQNTLSIISLGESTVAGVGINKHKEGMMGVFGQAFADFFEANVSWRVYAKSGYTAKEVRELILPELEESSPDVILVGLGGNDAFTLNTPWGWIKQIKLIVKYLEDTYPDVPIVFLGMPPIKQFPAFSAILQFVLGNLVEILGDTLEEYAATQKNVYYYARRLTAEDWRDRLGVQKTAEELFSDGVHPAKFTYQLWARDTFRYLMEETDISQKLRDRLSRMQAMN